MATIVDVEDTISEKTKAAASFTAFDITSALRAKGERVYHADVRT